MFAHKLRVAKTKTKNKKGNTNSTDESHKLSYHKKRMNMTEQDRTNQEKGLGRWDRRSKEGTSHIKIARQKEN